MQPDSVNIVDSWIKAISRIMRDNTKRINIKSWRTLGTYRALGVLGTLGALAAFRAPGVLEVLRVHTSS